MPFGTKNMDTQQAQQKVRQDIISLFEIDKMPEDKQEEMINRIGQLIFQSVLMRVLPTLNETDLKEYENMLDSGNVDPAKLFEFFMEKEPDFFDIIREESEKFREDAAEVIGGVEAKKEE